MEDVDMDLGECSQLSPNQNIINQEPASAYNLKIAVKNVTVAIDAANVCWSYLRSRPGNANKKFPPRLRPPLTGLQICFRFWQKHGIEPIAVCPEWWNHTGIQNIWGKDFEKTDKEIFIKLREEGKLYCAPSGEHDDLYIIDYSFRMDGFVVSNDKFRDHLSLRGLSTDWIEIRRIGYMWIQEEFIPNPDSMLKLENYVTNSASKAKPLRSSSGEFMDVDDQRPVADVFQRTQGACTENLVYSQASCSGSSNARENSETRSVPENKPITEINKIPSTPEVIKDITDVKTETLQVLTDYVKFIIGKGGSKIHELQSISECRISVRNSQGPTTTIELQGKLESLQSARQLIMDLIERMKHVVEPRLAKPDEIRIAKPDEIRIAKRDMVDRVSASEDDMNFSDL